MSGAAGDGAGEGGTGGAGAGGEGGADGSPPQVVTSFGCFAVSADGWETLGSGDPAVLIPGTPDRCGGRPICDNALGLSSETTPTSMRFVRRFVLDDDLIVATGEFVLSFVADDQARFFLNGQEVASCVPVSGNIAQCSADCLISSIPRSSFLGNGQVNTLEVELVNLLSAPTGNGTFGWTSLTYSICVEPEE